MRKIGKFSVIIHRIMILCPRANLGNFYEESTVYIESEGEREDEGVFLLFLVFF